MELLYLLMFLTGWFVCWIQMSRSESRQVAHWQSEYQEMERKWLAVSKQYANLHAELLESKSQLGRLEYQKSLVVGELWRLKNPVAPAEFESQQWKSPYPESGSGVALAVSDPDSTLTANPKRK
jgi:septal ring factor EnvC (AmiA/AmiB activator)